MSATPPRLLAIGGAHVDRRGRATVPFVTGASNPGIMQEEIGGGVFNAARAASWRGAAVSLLSVRGGDAAGEAVGSAIAAAGIRDLSVTFLDRRTASYTAILDDRGDVAAALADMALYDQVFVKQMGRRAARDAAAAADALLLDANLPAAAIGRALRLAGGKPAYGIAISPAKVVRFADHLADVSCLFLNLREAAALVGEGSPATRLRALAHMGLRRAVLTRGADPVLALDHDRIFEIAPPEIASVADVTGAGDALAGASVAALALGRPFAQALREGVAAATLAVRAATAAPELPDDAFREALASVPIPLVIDEQRTSST